MYLNIGDKVRLTDDVISSFFDKGEISISGTKGNIAAVPRLRSFSYMIRTNKYTVMQKSQS
jgi:hypothetical protein